MRMGRIEAVAAGLGAVSGVRSLAGLSLLAQRISRSRNGASRGLGSIAGPRLAGTTTALAIGEAIADKWFDLPARTKAGPLLGRIALGALAAGAFASTRRERWLGPALLGAGAAAIAATTATRLRRAVTRRTRTPDVVMGMLEDGIVVLASLWLARAIGGPRPHPSPIDDGWTDEFEVERFEEEIATRSDEPPGVDEIIAGQTPDSASPPWWSGPPEPIERAYGDPDEEDSEFGEPGRSEIT